MIIAIDPSFTSTGITLHEDDGRLIDYTGIHEGGSVYKSNKQLHKACSRIFNQLIAFCVKNDTKDLTVVIEYPAPNQSGFYLAILHGWLVGRLSLEPTVVRIVTFPPTAVNSFTKNKTKSKSYLVDYAKSKGWLPDKRINNDIATASILANCYLASIKGEYKNSVNILDLKK